MVSVLHLQLPPSHYDAELAFIQSSITFFQGCGVTDNPYPQDDEELECNMPEQFMNITGVDNQSSTLLSRAPRRAILVGVNMPGTDWPVEESLDELEQLATTAGVVCVDRVTQKLARAHSGTLL